MVLQNFLPPINSAASLLTYMATISSALTDGVIHLHALPDHDGRTALRPVYLADEFYDWVDNSPELHLPNWGARHGGRTRFEHLEAAVANFRCEKRPLVGDLNCVTPTSKGIWKIHCPGLRLFGWVPEEHSFIVVRGALNEHVHGQGAGAVVKGIVLDVQRFIRKHGLEKTIKRGDRRALFPSSE